MDYRKMSMYCSCAAILAVSCRVTLTSNANISKWFNGNYSIRRTCSHLIYYLGRFVP